MIRRASSLAMLALLLSAPLAADPGLPPPEAVERALA
jgi:hypothetical protein